MKERQDGAQPVITLTIHGLASDGSGVGSHQGLTVFVEGALPGEQVVVQLFEQHKRYAKGRLLSTQKTAPQRVTAPCPVFGRCGGCQLMHLAYAEQLEVKRQRVVDALQRLAKLDGALVAPCQPSPQAMAYRNKIQLPVCGVAGRLRFGLYERSSHNIVEVDRCLIHCSLGEEVLRRVRRCLDEHGIAPYDAATGKGELRHLLIKSAVHNRQVLVVLVTAGAASPALQKAAAQLVQADPVIKGVVQNIQRRECNTILGDCYRVLAGAGHIEEVLCGLTFKVSPASFFQVNPLQAEHLYQKAIALAQLTEAEVVLDAYCGVGTMALIMARSARRVVGIECVAAAIDDARHNAQRNGVQNCTFLCGAAEACIAQVGAVDVALLNPPRKGCDKALLLSLTRLAPQRVVYVSCDPATLARDLAVLCGSGYRLDAVHPFDMFPQTSHVESVALLRRL